ncbi:hypothetical protein ACFWF7_01225 [Nocardia sp. NPDC060256]|uniref:hypothetical protein n=1 Tax=unclassified Nocardia TaxID=2637762 RepID=UPI00366467D6
MQSIGTGGYRRSIAALALIIGGVVAATALSSGIAIADPGTRSDHTPGRGTRGDTTGAHHIDPSGYHHADANPLRQNEHQNSLREYRSQQNPAETTENRGNGAASTWTAVPRADGDGWVVCRPSASWC